MVESTRLFYKDGSSDKEYHASIEEIDGAYVVNFAYGRRGGALKSGTKTNSPVDLEKAKKIYEGIVHEKTAKGYTPDGTGATFVGTAKEDRKSGIVPQLSNSIDRDKALGLCKDPAYMAEEKLDGERRTLQNHNGEVRGINRTGLYVGVQTELYNDGLQLPDGVILDGELIGDTLHVFDLRQYGDNNIEHLGAGERYERLRQLIDHRDLKYIKVVPAAFTEEDKIRLFNEVQNRSGEGIVFKKIDSPYVPGRPNSGGNHLKFKFIESASVIVTEINDKRSVKISVVQDEDLVPVGNVTVLPNFDMPSVGDVIEVQYLYYYKKGSLFQPVYKGVRTDIPKEDCRIEQLKIKV